MHSNGAGLVYQKAFGWVRLSSEFLRLIMNESFYFIILNEPLLTDSHCVNF